MNKKIKVIELFDIIAKGIDIPARVEYKQKIYKFDSDIMDYVSQGGELCLSLVIADYDNFKESLNVEVEILEDEEEIDIQGIKEMEYLEDYEADKTDIRLNRDKINEILRAVKQLYKKINKGGLIMPQKLIGRQVMTDDGHKGIVIKHFYATARGMMIYIKEDDGRVWFCPESSIIYIKED